MSSIAPQKQKKGSSTATNTSPSCSVQDAQAAVDTTVRQNTRKFSKKTRPMPDQSAQVKQRQASYAKAIFSYRVGRLIPESDASLCRTRHDWFEMAAEENLGPPDGMTTYVGNSGTGAILAHVTEGPCAKPDPEVTFTSLVDGKFPLPSTTYTAIKAAEYMRRRADFEQVAFQGGRTDTLHGRITDHTRRSEAQKRGDQHEHYV